jgi:hypothetical protein
MDEATRLKLRRLREGLQTLTDEVEALLAEDPPDEAVDARERHTLPAGPPD